jgi:hypothetical protein
MGVNDTPPRTFVDAVEFDGVICNRRHSPNDPTVRAIAASAELDAAWREVVSQGRALPDVPAGLTRRFRMADGRDTDRPPDVTTLANLVAASAAVPRAEELARAAAERLRPWFPVGWSPPTVARWTVLPLQRPAALPRVEFSHAWLDPVVAWTTSELGWPAPAPLPPDRESLFEDTDRSWNRHEGHPNRACPPGIRGLVLRLLRVLAPADRPAASAVLEALNAIVLQQLGERPPWVLAAWSARHVPAGTPSPHLRGQRVADLPDPFEPMWSILALGFVLADVTDALDLVAIDGALDQPGAR